MNAMTHYMELLTTAQPWHLLIFMAVPVICAETLAITELMILFTRNLTGLARKVNKVTGIFAGLYFLGVFIYLLGVIPFMGIFLLEIGAIGRKRDEVGKLKFHAIFVGIFLVVAHVAMIVGMLNPNLLIMKPML
jgi:hypothetical protein